MRRRGRPLLPSRAEPTDALIARIHDYAESSAVVHLLTADRGAVRAIAKGAKRTANSFLGPLDQGVLYRVRLGRRAGEGLVLLHSAVAREPFPRLRADPERFLAAAVVLEIAADLLPEGEPNAELFRLVCFTLKVIDRAPPDRLPLAVAFFLVRVVGLSGHVPETSACVVCGRAWATTEPLRLSAALGGVAHADCARADGQARVLRPESLALFDRLRRGPAGDLLAMEVSSRDLAEVRGLLVHWLEQVLERRFHAALSLEEEFVGRVRPRG